jgi:hypothetical protein
MRGHVGHLNGGPFHRFFFSLERFTFSLERFT